MIVRNVDGHTCSRRRRDGTQQRRRGRPEIRTHSRAREARRIAPPRRNSGSGEGRRNRPRTRPRPRPRRPRSARAAVPPPVRRTRRLSGRAPRVLQRGRHLHERETADDTSAEDSAAEDDPGDDAFASRPASHTATRIAREDEQQRPQKDVLPLGQGQTRVSQSGRRSSGRAREGRQGDLGIGSSYASPRTAVRRRGRSRSNRSRRNLCFASAAEPANPAALLDASEQTALACRRQQTFQ